MKKLMKLFFGLLLAGSVLISCDKDDDDVSKKNYLKIGETEYVLSSGIYENYGQMEAVDFQYDGYNLDLTLLSSGLTSSTNSDGFPDISGSGQIIYFEMFSSKENEFDSRDYTFSTSEPYPVGTFDDGSFCINYSVENEDNNWIDISSGKVTISKAGDTYSITIDCTSEKGDIIKGFFQGTLQYFDYTGQTKSTSMISSKISKRKK